MRYNELSEGKLNPYSISELYGWVKFSDGSEVDLEAKDEEEVQASLVELASKKGLDVVSIGEEDIGDEAHWYVQYKNGHHEQWWNKNRIQRFINGLNAPTNEVNMDTFTGTRNTAREEQELMAAARRPAQQRIRNRRLMASDQGGYSEEDFIEDARDWGTAPEDQWQMGEGNGDQVEIVGNTVTIPGGYEDRPMGTLVSKGGNAIAMYGMDGDDLVGIIVRMGPNMYNAFHYQTGYVGTNKTMEAALDTLIIARWS